MALLTRSELIKPLAAMLLINSELEVPEQAHAMVMPLRGTKLPEKPRRRGSMHRIVAETTSAQIKSFLSIAVVNMKS